MAIWSYRTATYTAIAWWLSSVRAIAKQQLKLRETYLMENILHESRLLMRGLWWNIFIIYIYERSTISHWRESDARQNTKQTELVRWLIDHCVWRDQYFSLFICVAYSGRFLYWAFHQPCPAMHCMYRSGMPLHWRFLVCRPL